MGVTVNAEEVIERIKTLLDARNDDDVSRYFGVSKSTVGNWRQRNSIPWDYCAKLALEKGKSLDWLIYGVCIYEGKAEIPFPVDRVESPQALYNAGERAQRIIRFVLRWETTRHDDDMAWLERHLSRTIPEYSDYLHHELDK